MNKKTISEVMSAMGKKGAKARKDSLTKEQRIEHAKMMQKARRLKNSLVEA